MDDEIIQRIDERIEEFRKKMNEESDPALRAYAEGRANGLMLAKTAIQLGNLSMIDEAIKEWEMSRAVQDGRLDGVLWARLLLESMENGGDS